MRKALLLACLVWAAPAVAEPVPAARLNSTTQALQQTKENEARLQQQLESTAADLSTLRHRATDLAGSLQESEAKTSRAERDLSTLNGELSDTEREFARRKQEYAHTVMSLMRMRSLPPTALFGDKESATQMMRTGEVLRNTNAALAARAESLRSEMERISRLRREVGARKQQLTKERTVLSEKQKQLAADMQTRQRLQEKLSRDHAAAKAQVSRLSRESASLQELIGKLEKAQPQFAHSKAPPSASLNATKGQLKLPVVGSVLHKFGERKNANETYRGMVLSARTGATVVAPYAGEVVFTGPFMDYGSMVLLKHGKGFISILAGLGNISVGLNQQLAKGEPIGSMGGGNPRLYIELRDHSKPIDPANWFANVPSSLASR